MAMGIALMLRAAGFVCTLAALGTEGMELARAEDQDIIILDLGLPDIDGYEVLRSLRQAGIRTPVLILSGFGHIDNRIKGLGYGADDFMSKPFDRRELVARVEAVVRRDRRRHGVVITVGRLRIDLDRRIVTADGRELHLTSREFAIMDLLAQRRGQVVSKQSLMTHLYHDRAGEPALKILDVFVSKLRRKLALATGGADYISTVWGTGYVLRDTAPEVWEVRPAES